MAAMAARNDGGDCVLIVVLLCVKVVFMTSVDATVWAFGERVCECALGVWLWGCFWAEWKIFDKVNGLVVYLQCNPIEVDL